MTVSLSSVPSQLVPVLTALFSNTYGQQPVPPVMTPSLDSLINQSMPLKVVGAQNNAGVKPSVIQAMVLSSTALTSAAGGNYKVLLTDGKQQFEMISKAPLTVGSQLQLKVTQGLQSAVLLNILSNNTHPAPSAQTTAQTTAQAAAAAVTHASAGRRASDLHSANRPLSRTGIIEQAVRQSLPQQQPLQQLLPLLQRIIEQPQTHWPKALTQNVQYLLRQFPTAEQMQQAKPIKQAVENSGIFLESKLARLALNEQTTSGRADKSPLLQSDIKAVLQQLSKQLEKSLTVKPSPQSSDGDHQRDMPLPHLPVYNSKAAPTSSSTGDKSEQNLDILLRQLSRQLLASIARTQLNQLESLGARQANTPETQTAQNSWVTEIPIVHGKHVDNLSLRIDQHTPEQGTQQQQQKLWTVMLTFDLHILGKMNVQLKVLNRDVSAVIWSSLQQTHNQVKQHVDELSNNLRQVGVSVCNIECQLGTPPNHHSPLMQQLVDVRT